MRCPEVDKRGWRCTVKGEHEFHNNSTAGWWTEPQDVAAEMAALGSDERDATPIDRPRWFRDEPEVLLPKVSDFPTEYTEAGVDRLIRMVQESALARENRIRHLMEEGGMNVHQAAAVHDVIAGMCADMMAEESERLNRDAH